MITGGIRSGGEDKKPTEGDPANKTEPKPEDAGDKKSYSEADMERVIASRLARDRKDEKAKLVELETKLAGVGNIEAELQTLRDFKHQQEEDKMSAEDRVKAQHKRDLDKIVIERDALKQKYDLKSRAHLDYQKQVILTNAAVKNDAIEPSQVCVLLNSRVKVIESENGGGDEVIFLSDDGAELSIEDGVKEFMENNPHLVRNPGGSGSGSRFPRGKGKAITVEAIRAMTRTERKERSGEIQAFLDDNRRAQQK